MKKGIVLALVVLVAAIAGQAHAASTTWVPGSTYYISEDDATNFLEKAFDYAYCQGIPRYGHRGEFPDEEFTRFDCTLEQGNGTTCYEVRVIGIKGSRPGAYRVKAPKAQPKAWCS